MKHSSLSLVPILSCTKIMTGGMQTNTSLHVRPAFVLLAELTPLALILFFITSNSGDFPTFLLTLAYKGHSAVGK